MLWYDYHTKVQERETKYFLDQYPFNYSEIYIMLTTILAVVWWLIVWSIVGFFWYKARLTRDQLRYHQKIEETEEEASKILRNAKILAEERETKSLKTIEKAHEDIQKRHEKIDDIENRMITREERFDEKIQRLDQKKEALEKQKSDIQILQEEQEKKLSDIAWLSRDEAREQIFFRVETEYEHELWQMKTKLITFAKQDAQQHAKKLIAQALPRVSADSVSTYTTTLIDIPHEDFKWKLIWREWRNISFFEKTTWIELIIDDTPEIVKLSSLDPERRFIAQHTLERLLADWRINPYYITKYYEEVLWQIDDIRQEKGQEALTLVNIWAMKPEITRHIGRFFCRYSYGQNLRNHSIEVAKIAWALASEMWYDAELATKAGLLHDIWKVIANKDESHTELWAAFLLQQWVSDVIVNAAASHHFEVPMTDPISWIIASADALSSARPWARFNSKDKFFEKMTKLEKIIWQMSWVQKVHIMQAWREIMVYVDPQVISDNQLQDVVKDIWKNLEDHLDYPGIIRVVAIREQKMIEFLR